MMHAGVATTATSCHNQTHFHFHFYSISPPVWSQPEVYLCLSSLTSIIYVRMTVRCGAYPCPYLSAPDVGVIDRADRVWRRQACHGRGRREESMRSQGRV